jgi:catalase
VDGIRAAAPGTKGDYLQDELKARLKRSAVEFVLRMQVGEQGDDTADPTRAWPVTRPRVVMGHLLLRALAPDTVAEHLSFNPTRLVSGIAPSDDPILAVRDPVYQRSFARRSARWSGPTTTPPAASPPDPV